MERKTRGIDRWMEQTKAAANALESTVVPSHRHEKTRRSDTEEMKGGIKEMSKGRKDRFLSLFSHTPLWL